MTGNTANTTVPMLLSIREAALALGVSERTVWAISAPRGPLKTTRIGGRVLYARRHLEEFIEASAASAES